MGTVKRVQLRTIVAGLAVALLVVSMAASTAVAAWYVNDDGTGFVGKGDVQQVYGWNNKALQENADKVDFRVSTEVVTEVSWTCTNSSNHRERTTTTTLSGVLTTVARDRNQITGFILSGYDSDPTTSTSTEGNPLNSCPSGPWSLTTPAGEPEVVSSTSSLEVSIDGTNWFDVP